METRKQTRSPPVSLLPGGFLFLVLTALELVVLLLSLIGGAVYVTFQITWTVSHSDEHKKK